MSARSRAIAHVCVITMATNAQTRAHDQDVVRVSSTSGTGMGVGAYRGYGKRVVVGSTVPRGGASESSDMIYTPSTHYISKI